MLILFADAIQSGDKSPPESRNLGNETYPRCGYFIWKAISRFTRISRSASDSSSTDQTWYTRVRLQWLFTIGNCHRIVVQVRRPTRQIDNQRPTRSHMRSVNDLTIQFFVSMFLTRRDRVSPACEKYDRPGNYRVTDEREGSIINIGIKLK